MAKQEFFDLAWRFMASASILCTSGSLYFCFTVFHLLPLFRESFSCGVIEAIIFNGLFFFLALCFTCCMLGQTATAEGGAVSEPNGSAGLIRDDGASFVPVVFVSSCILGLYLIYTVFHLWPQLWEESGRADSSNTCIIEALCFNVLTILLVLCYIRCIVASPGAIPSGEEDPTWEYATRECRQGRRQSGSFLGMQERKHSTGQRRHCKWCAMYKPDRAHHCRVCHMCVLKMDHHCPWIVNCVGFKNHKYFFLLILYALMDCIFITWTMLESVRRAVADGGTSPVALFLLLFGETLAAFLGALAIIFFSFHCWLMLKGMTTIEFLEKSTKRPGGRTSPYNLGLIRNVQAVLGDNPLLWLLPCSPPAGTGVVFQCRDTCETAWLTGHPEGQQRRRLFDTRGQVRNEPLFQPPYGSVQY